MPSAKKSGSGKDYPQLDRGSSSRAALAAALEADDIEIAAISNPKAKKASAPSSSKLSPEEIALTDMGEVLQAHAEKRRTTVPMSKKASEAFLKRRWMQFVLLCIICGLVIPIGCIVLSIVLQRPDEEGGQWPFVFLIPAGFSLAILTLVAFNQRGPGGVLEKRGYKVGCLPCTARQPDEE